MLKWIDRIIRNTLYLVLLLVVLGFFGNYNYLLDLFSHFYLQYFFVVCLLLLMHIWRKQWREALVSVLLSLFLFSQLLSADFSGIWGENYGKDADIFYMNAYYWNEDISSITSYIQDIRPQWIILVELNQELFRKIQKEGQFQYSYYYPDGPLSFGFFTNDKALEQKTITSAGYPIGYFRTEKMAYYVIHPLPPLSPKLYRDQKIFFAAVSELIQQEKNDFLVIGDFNSTVYSRVFQSFFGKHHYQPVYSWWVDNILTIPIDYAVSNKKLTIEPWNRLSSDHIPLLIRY